MRDNHLNQDRTSPNSRSRPVCDFGRLSRRLRASSRSVIAWDDAYMYFPCRAANPIPCPLVPPALRRFLPAYCVQRLVSRSVDASVEESTHDERVNEACDGQNSADDSQCRG